MKINATGLLSILIAVSFLAAFVAALVQSGGGKTEPGTKMLLHEVASVNEALVMAEREGKTVMIDFNASWCPPCRSMKEEAFTDPSVAELLKDTLFVSVDVDHPGDNADSVEEFKPQALPTVVFLDSAGKAIGRIRGFGGVASFKSEVRRILRKT